MADIAKVSYAIRETLQRVVVYKTVHSVISERLVGDGIGYNARIYAGHLVRETLIKIPAIQVASVRLEVLAAMPGEFLTQARIVGGFKQAVVVARDPMPPPSTVKSLTRAGSLRAQVAQGRTWVQPRSGEFAMTLRHQVVQRIVQVDMRSAIQARTLQMLVARSRDRAYVPESAVYTAVYRHQVLQRRNVIAAPAMRSPIQAGTLVQAVLQSRRVVVGITDIFAASLHEQVLVQDTRPAPISTLSAVTLRQLVLHRRDVTPPGIDDRVAGFVQQVAIPHVVVPAIGVEHVGGLQHLVAIKRAVAAYRSAVQTGAFFQQSLQRAFYPAPGYLLGWRTYGLRQQIIAARAHGPIIGHAYVSSLRVAFAQRRVTLPPIDVIDPAVGRHIASLRQLTAQRRVTLPPEQGSQALFALSVIEQVAARDVFPPPDYPDTTGDAIVSSLVEIIVARDNTDWAPVSVLRATAVIEQVAIGDNLGWIDPTTPRSDAVALAVIEQVAVGDVFGDPTIPLSAAEVLAVIEQVAVGEVFVDPTIPQSVAQVEQVIEQVAIGDVFPDPLIPISTAQVLTLTESVAFHDDDLTGKFTMSTITVNAFAQVIVLPDKSMVGIPLRHGPRPVVSITIS